MWGQSQMVRYERTKANNENLQSGWPVINESCIYKVRRMDNWNDSGGRSHQHLQSVVQSNICLEMLLEIIFQKPSQYCCRMLWMFSSDSNWDHSGRIFNSKNMKTHKITSSTYGGCFNTILGFKITTVKVLCRKKHCHDAKLLVQPKIWSFWINTLL